MRWSEFFTGMKKQSMEGLLFYREYWLETLIIFTGIVEKMMKKDELEEDHMELI